MSNLILADNLARAQSLAAGGRDTVNLGIGQPGAEIMYPDPGFEVHDAMIRHTGATAVPVAQREDKVFAFSAENISEAVRPIRATL